LNFAYYLENYPKFHAEYAEYAEYSDFDEVAELPIFEQRLLFFSGFFLTPRVWIGIVLGLA
jgi:hypothetical protein